MDLPYVILEAGEALADGLAMHLARSDGQPLVRADPPDILGWADGPSPRIAVVVVRSEPVWELLEKLGRIADAGRLTVVALLPDSSTAAMRKAAALGATSAVPADTPPADLAAICRLAVRGYGVFRAAQVQALAASELAAEGETAAAITSQQRGWLKRLDRGESAVAMAREVGYSERHFRRLLLKTYNRLGAATRRQALDEADRLGLLA